MLDELDKVVTECDVLSKEVSPYRIWLESIACMHDILSFYLQLQCMGRDLLANEQGGPLAQMRVTPGQPSLHQTLGAIVVHAATILQWRQRVDILKPFVNMLNDPAGLTVSAKCN